MIFITLGTQDKPFPRLLKAVEKEIKKGNIKDKVIVQAGSTKFISNHMEIVDFLNMNEFNNYIKECNLIITHAGVGTILEALKLNKKVIAIPRLSKYDEAINDHQLQLCKEFKDKGYILTDDIKKLDEIIKNAESFIPKKFISNNTKFNNLIQKLID